MGSKAMTQNEGKYKVGQVVLIKENAFMGTVEEVEGKESYFYKVDINGKINTYSEEELSPLPPKPPARDSNSEDGEDWEPMFDHHFKRVLINNMSSYSGVKEDYTLFVNIKQYIRTLLTTARQAERMETLKEVKKQYWDLVSELEDPFTEWIDKAISELGREEI